MQIFIFNAGDGTGIVRPNECTIHVHYICMAVQKNRTLNTCSFLETQLQTFSSKLVPKRLFTSVAIISPDLDSMICTVHYVCN